MDEFTKKKQFLQLQFSLVLLVCSLLPDFGNMVSSALGFWWLGPLQFLPVNRWKTPDSIPLWCWWRIGLDTDYLDTWYTYVA